MATSRKIVLHARDGYRPGLDGLVIEWMRTGVAYVGVVGKDASRIEDIIDELCVGDASAPCFMLTAAHGPNETVEDAVSLAQQLSEPDAPVEVVEF